MQMRMKYRLTLAAAIVAIGGCTQGVTANSAAAADVAPGAVVATITSSNGPHRFTVEVARTADEQQRGLMFRTNIPANAGMIFTPYPPEGGPPREASFWMKNTPSPLDIIFIRPDHTIARIAENAVPYDETPIPSGEPVAAVLEINGGRAADLGIAAGDKVAWR